MFERIFGVPMPEPLQLPLSFIGVMVLAAGFIGVIQWISDHYPKD